MKSIFEPIQIGSLCVKNRIEVAPAAPFLTGADGSVTPEFYAYTTELARSGAGIVMIGVTGVDERPPISGRTLSASSPLFLSGLSDIAEGIKSCGAAAGIELVHGRYMLSPPDSVAQQTSTAEVERIIADFVNAARLCQTAGFDIIMIHGGHGNVPSMFFNKKFNHRTDRFGGSFENRCRFGIELLRGIKEATGGKLAVEYRISAEEMQPDMTTLEETLEYAKVIEPYIDLLHVSRGLLEVDALLPFINAPSYLPRAMNLPYAKRFKESLTVPVSVVGSFDLETAEKAISNGDVDMVAMIRTVLADTRCVEKARHGRDAEIRPCIRCNTCISRTHSMFKTVRCAVNPLIGRETRFDTRKTEAPRNVAVIGGGIAGIQAALTAADKGHTVTLFEKTDKLGGLLNLAAVGELKTDLRVYLDWARRVVSQNAQIEIRLSTEATPALLANAKFDALILGIGAKPIIPHFTASGTGSVLWVGDAEENPARLGENVVIAGAGVTGMEFALTLAALGKSVTLVDLLPEEQTGGGATPINLIALRALLQEANVRIIGETRIEDVNADGAVLQKDGAQTLLPCDNVVLSLGFRPDEELLSRFSSAADDVYIVGDAKGGGSVWNAVTSGFDAAMRL
ncbi:MAG: NAD(P)/FAD-dependent oxidoreductase [Oscillospiraceae bacterium]|jgi:2,4-dienoyl-CoA reductase-like NADH-dependent reductase (Old Yellow Enzyme family)/thioredoxin reductase|nr:NAD(P)/FAD-dependent oxidoreductase [Oscillospiraceae bacterium]